MISKRTEISIEQFLSIIDEETCRLLSIKHGNNTKDLVKEIMSIKNFLRNRNTATISSSTTFKEMFNNLEKDLLLDGYKIENNELIQIEPTIDGVIAFEDDLTNEINKTNLSQKEAIIQKIEASAVYFKEEKYNECLFNARIALETIVRDEVFSEKDSKWGEALNGLKSDNVLNEKDEKMIANTYTFISDGSHIHLGFTEEEYARYARNLCMSMCYFLIKKINSNINTND